MTLLKPIALSYPQQQIFFDWTPQNSSSQIRSCSDFPFVALAIALPANAALLALYDFTDGDLTDNEVGPAETLSLVTNGSNLITTTTEGAAVFPGEAAGDRDYLEVERGAGAGAFTVSIWFKTDTINQGGFQGIFSNNIANVADNFSWQIDVNNGVLRFVSATTGFGSITNAEAGEPQIQTGVWNHVVARKTGGSAADFWLGTESTPLQSLGTANLNPGGLQWFRLGVNRNSDSLYAMEMANVKIYDDVDVSLTDLNNEAPNCSPYPSHPPSFSQLWSFPPSCDADGNLKSHRTFLKSTSWEVLFSFRCPQSRRNITRQMPSH
ncbi:MAG: hypothetical protein P1U90_18295 [Akkermansiaceae bacterium]|nr:hypothetical protein [Akkermansiaceae bacterium]